jgi:hypothetical protein
MILFKKKSFDITIIRQEQGEWGGREEKGKKEKEALEGRKKVVDIILNNIYNRRLQINVKNKVHQMHNIRLVMDDIDHKDI